VLVGVDVVLGMIVATVGSGLAMGVLGDKVRGRDVAIGSIMAFALGLGTLFLALSSKLAGQASNILFGDILGIADSDVQLTLVVSAITWLVLAALYRPLLFASIDPEVADTRGVPVTALGVTFMVLLAFTVAEAVLVVGVLLIFALLITPAATAQHLTARPGLAILWSIVLAVLSVWAGLIVGFYLPYPPSFFITTISFALYLLIRWLVPGVGSARRRSARLRAQQAATP
jgi:zinc/manganese transport system permease protein